MQWHDPSHQKCPVSSSFLASVIFMILPTVNYPTHDPTHGKFVFIMPPTLELGCWAFFDVFRNLIHSVFPFISSFRDNCMSSLQFHCKDNTYLCSLKINIYTYVIFVTLLTPAPSSAQKFGTKKTTPKKDFLHQKYQKHINPWYFDTRLKNLTRVTNIR